MAYWAVYVVGCSMQDCCIQEPCILGADLSHTAGTTPLALDSQQKVSAVLWPSMILAQYRITMSFRADTG